MVKVIFTKALGRFYPDLDAYDSDQMTIADILDEMECRYPGLKDYIVDEQLVLRQHVNIFLDQKMIEDRTALHDVLDDIEEVYFMQALSGG